MPVSGKQKGARYVSPLAGLNGRLSEKLSEHFSDGRFANINKRLGFA